MKSKILVADDSETVREIVSEALEKSDAIIEGIGNGEAAFSLLNEFNADLILVKSDIPGLSGSQLSEKIKRSKQYYTAKVILLIGESEDFTDKQFLESMADDLVFKPFKSTEIFKKIKKALGKRLEEALEDVELDWQESAIADDDPETSFEKDSKNDLDSEDIDLALPPNQKAKEMENAYLNVPQDDDGIEDFESNEYEKDAYEDALDLTEAMIDISLIADPPQIPPEEMELSYFLASGETSKEDANEDDDSGDADYSSPDVKWDTNFNIFLESIGSTKELKNVFERILFLDSYMKEREISDLTESVSNSIQDVMQDITPNIVRNIIKKEIKK